LMESGPFGVFVFVLKTPIGAKRNNQQHEETVRIATSKVIVMKGFQ